MGVGGQHSKRCANTLLIKMLAVAILFLFYFLACGGSHAQL